MGESAGGGHAAALAIAVRDRGRYALAGQVLVYPMLDDRTGSRNQPPAHQGRYVWTAEQNRLGWGALLGAKAGSPHPPRGSVPARVEDLRGLPPTFIGVGGLDLSCGRMSTTPAACWPAASPPSCSSCRAPTTPSRSSSPTPRSPVGSAGRSTRRSPGCWNRRRADDLAIRRSLRGERRIGRVVFAVAFGQPVARRLEDGVAHRQDRQRGGEGRGQVEAIAGVAHEIAQRAHRQGASTALAQVKNSNSPAISPCCDLAKQLMPLELMVG